MVFGEKLIESLERARARMHGDRGQIPPERGFDSSPLPLTWKCGYRVVSRRALDRLGREKIITAFREHSKGDWGTAREARIEANHRALMRGGAL